MIVKTDESMAGNVHLSTLHEFRDKSHYKGKILDLDEGRLVIENVYSCYEGLAKNADGAMPLFLPPYKKVSALGSTFSQAKEVSDVLIYCVTRFLFSDSLRWAKEEKKDSCALITHFELFLTQVSAACSVVKPAFDDPTISTGS